jgi:hypothetical protein
VHQSRVKTKLKAITDAPASQVYLESHLASVSNSPMVGTGYAPDLNALCGLAQLRSHGHEKHAPAAPVRARGWVHGQ